MSHEKIFLKGITNDENYVYQNVIQFFSFIVDCIWDKWQVGQCSKSCDGGERQITRSRKVEASHGGYDCEGPSNITESCNVEGCPGGINQAK